MPGYEGADPRAADASGTHASDPGGASAHSRRIFLAGAGAGVAAAATAGVVTSSASAATAPAGGEEAAQGGRAIVAYVSDVSGGQISLLQGEQEVVVRDRALARALAQRFDRGVSAGQARTTTTEEL
jgi:hypothetical protein